MKKIISYLTVMVMVLCMASCSNTANKARLLESVPKDASIVAVFNIQELSKKLNNTIDKNGVSYSATFQKCVDQMSRSEKKCFNSLYGDGAIDPSWIIVYEYDNNVYVSGIVKDEKKFKSAIEDALEDSFATEEGIQVCANLAMDDGIFVMSSKNRDSENPIALLKLDSKMSIADTDLGKRIKDKDDDIYAVTTIANIPNIDELAYFKMGLSTAFKGAEYIEMTTDFEDGEAELKAEILDSKFEEAKVNSMFKLNKLNFDVINKLPSGAMMTFAIDIPSSLIKNIMPMVASMGGSLNGIPSNILDLLNNIDGTLAIGFYSAESTLDFAFALEMKNSDAAIETVNTLSNEPFEGYFNLSTDGRIVTCATNNIATGNTFGTPSHINELKDASAGYILNSQFIEDLLSQRGLSNKTAPNIVISADYDDDTASIEAKAIFNQKNKNSLKLFFDMVF
jgi:hypothetical protein